MDLRKNTLPQFLLRTLCIVKCQNLVFIPKIRFDLRVLNLSNLLLSRVEPGLNLLEPFPNNPVTKCYIIYKVKSFKSH